MNNANECRHEYRDGLAIVNGSLIKRKQRQLDAGCVVTVSDSHFNKRVVSCRKCTKCGHSIGVNYDTEKETTETNT